MQTICEPNVKFHCAAMTRTTNFVDILIHIVQLIDCPLQAEKGLSRLAALACGFNPSTRHTYSSSWMTKNCEYMSDAAAKTKGFDAGHGNACTKKASDSLSRCNADVRWDCSSKLFFEERSDVRRGCGRDGRCCAGGDTHPLG